MFCIQNSFVESDMRPFQSPLSSTPQAVICYASGTWRAETQTVELEELAASSDVAQIGFMLSPCILAFQLQDISPLAAIDL